MFDSLEAGASCVALEVLNPKCDWEWELVGVVDTAGEAMERGGGTEGVGEEEGVDAEGLAKV